MDLGVFLSIIIGAIFVNNFILTRFLGLCPFIGVSRQVKPSISMGMAVTFVTTFASVITWLLYKYVLVPFHIEFLRTITFILVIATFVQLVEMVILKMSPPLYRALGIYLPLITTNCAVMGVAVLNSDMFFENGKSLQGGFLLASVQGLCVGIGFTLAIVLMSGIRERLDVADVPEAFKGPAIAFVVACLMSMAFMGFAGFKFF